MVSFWWLSVLWILNMRFSIVYALSFSIHKFYFINAFWRVITASCFECVCSGLLWFNLCDSWIELKNTHTSCPSGVFVQLVGCNLIYYVYVCITPYTYTPCQSVIRLWYYCFKPFCTLRKKKRLFRVTDIPCKQVMLTRLSAYILLCLHLEVAKGLCSLDCGTITL